MKKHLKLFLGHFVVSLILMTLSNIVIMGTADFSVMSLFCASFLFAIFLYLVWGVARIFNSDFETDNENKD